MASKTITSNGVSVVVEDGQLCEYEGINIIGKDYRQSSRNWGTLFNENFLNLASKIKALFVSLSDIYTKTQTDQAIDDRINFLVGSAPQNLDTLYEIAMKLNENDGVMAQLLALINLKADKLSSLDYGLFGFSSNVTTGLSVGSKLPIFSPLSSANSIVCKSPDTITLKGGKTYRLSAEIGASSFSSSNTEFMALFRASSGVDISTSVYILPQSFSADSRYRNASARGLVRFAVDTDINFVVTYNTGLNTIYANYSSVLIEELRVS